MNSCIIPTIISQATHSCIKLPLVSSHAMDVINLDKPPLILLTVKVHFVVIDDLHLSEGDWLKTIASEPVESHMFLAYELGVGSVVVSTLLEPVCKLLIVFHSVVVQMAVHLCTVVHADIMLLVQKEQCCRNVNYYKVASFCFNQGMNVGQLHQ